MNIEAGNYSFRVIGMNASGEMIVISSPINYVSDHASMLKHQREFIQSCRLSRGIIKPKLSHVVRESDGEDSFYTYANLVDLNSDY